MEGREVAVRISHLTKEYRLGQLGGGTLQHDLQSWWARVRGREDPNSKLVVKGRMRGEKFVALDDVDLTIYSGEAIGIIGRNGAGKSTLLKIISRITAPTAGEIDIYGRISSMLEVGTGFHPEMTGRENVYLNGAILGMSRAEIEEKFDDIVEFAEIGQFIDTPVKRYSSGMYVKLAFSVAAHLDNDIMIMDEVLAVGDAAFRKKCLEKMQQKARSGKTVLYVSHNMDTIRTLCDRCAVLDGGRLVFVGDNEEAIKLYLESVLDTRPTIDLADAPREDGITPSVAKLVLAEFPGRESIRFGRGEKLRMRLRWENLADYEDICVRLEVLTAEGRLQGSGVLFDVRSGAMGETEELDVELDVSNLGEATYKTKVTLFQRGFAGEIYDLDSVIGLFFETEQAPDEFWDVSHWGNLRLEGLKAL